MKKATFQSSGNATNCPKSSSNSGGHCCLCSLTTHVGSFCCRIHRQSCNSQVRTWTNAKIVDNKVSQDLVHAFLRLLNSKPLKILLLSELYRNHQLARLFDCPMKFLCFGSACVRQPIQQMGLEIRHMDL